MNKKQNVAPLTIISYKTCPTCKIRIHMNEKFQFVCTQCGKELKGSNCGWGGK